MPTLRDLAMEPDVSTHAPREGRDKLFKSIDDAPDIVSTHAPREGRDCQFMHNSE